MAYVGVSQLRGEEPEPPPQWPVRCPSCPNAPTAPAIPQRWLQPIGDRKPEASSLAFGVRQGERIQFE